MHHATPLKARGPALSALFALVIPFFFRSPARAVPLPDPRPASAPFGAALPARNPARTVPLDRLPLSFEANRGQADPRVRFLSRSAGYTLFLTPREAVFSLRPGGAPGDTAGTPGKLSPKAPDSRKGRGVLRMRLVGANPKPEVRGEAALSGKTHYFLGKDPERWKTGVPSYRKIRYESVYPGVDWVFYGTPDALEYDFIAAPGADLRRIRFRLSGAKSLTLDRRGDLVIGTAGGPVVQEKPRVYQEVEGKRKLVAGNYLLDEQGRIGFRIGKYDKKRPLVIDPVLRFSTYFKNAFNANAVALDADGNFYVTGTTVSDDFPTQDPIFPLYHENTDAYVAKINPTGTQLIWSTYLGGTGIEEGHGIAVDRFGNTYVVGVTISTNFPTKNPFQSARKGDYDAFVTKINPSGSALVYSTYLGGSENDHASHIAVVATEGQIFTVYVYVTGWTRSADFPVKNAIQPSHTSAEDQNDAFLARLNLSGDDLVFSTYYGGSKGDFAQSVTMDEDHRPVVVGSTESDDFPVQNAVQPNFGGDDTDGFVLKLNAGGTQRLFSTYLGGSNVDVAYDVAVDGQGNAVVVGYTRSQDFPKKDPYQGQLGGNLDMFVTKVAPAGNAVLYSTYLGGSGTESAQSVALDSDGFIYVMGHTASQNFPLQTPFQSELKGTQDLALAKFLPSGAALVYSTYLGGTDTEFAGGMAVDDNGNLYGVGKSLATDFPTTAGTLYPQSPGNEAVLFKVFDPKPTPPCGDVDGSGVVDVADAIRVLRYIVGVGPLTSQQAQRADVNHDDTLNISDAVIILRIAVQLDPPC